ncbi:hypothetical protein CQW23_16965 [Capsicum baccatum]|uniref:Uncharacterized protein n=1 Tax=Capsicum baccatum TaxID=33114 RepID=A0A2G2WCV1_CAPBA|nr:hypothetical protein CQW23_16965 [Capsicum baccatum]
MIIEDVPPPGWYPNSGASTHMTYDPTLLSSYASYNGSSQVMVDNPATYRQIVGWVQYLSSIGLDVQLDAVNMCSQFLHQPHQYHLQAVEWVFYYLKAKCDNIGEIHLSHNLVLHSRAKHGALDYNFVREKVSRDNPATYRQIVGWVQYLSSIGLDVQLDAVNMCSQFLHQPHQYHLQAVEWVFYYLKAKCDNIGEIHLSHNLVLHSRAKHGALDYNFVREKVSRG